jgi:hypothetical protein
MAHNPSEASKNEAYRQGYEDAQNGTFAPPKGDSFVDFIFAPIDALAGSPSSKEVADSKSEAYRDGHSSGSRK